MEVNKKSHEEIVEIDGSKYKDMLIAALMWLKEQQTLIDSLNVFPVPDGDTGTNMYLTFLDAVREVKKLDTDNVSIINASLAKGALMGARGNSGVILSQLIRGFQVANKENKMFSRENLVQSLKKASEVAYQGVLKPVEGTILTVSRKAAEGAEMALNNKLDIIGIMENTIAYARDALNKTPEQLPALKEAGVVDAGGQGYLTILEGMLKGLIGEKAFEQQDLDLVKPTTRNNKKKSKLEYLYCTQLLIDLKEKKSMDKIKKDLESNGDSLLVVGSGNIVKIHIHTNHPGKILEYALKFGDINNIKIDNMQLQSAEKIEKAEKEQQMEFIQSKGKGIIAVGQGEGIKQILNELGVDTVIDGGQSMNPSTNDFLEAINNLNNLEIIILPNNKNVISAARQAASLTDKRVKVIPTRSIPQAISSMLVFDEDSNLNDLQEAMTNEMKMVKTIELTTAIKDSRVNGIDIKAGDIIGLFNHDIKSKGKTYQEVIINLINDILEEEELVTIYYGKDVNEEEAIKTKNIIADKFAFEEIEIYNGKQPLYPYIISLE